MEIPTHVAIVMDGNGRWASQRGLPHIRGHQAGVEAVRRVAEACERMGVKVLTIFVFSTENWRREVEEVEGLLLLIEETFRQEIEELDRRGVQVRISGALEDLPASLRSELERGMARTARNKGLILNLAVNYGSRREITEAVRKIAAAIRRGRLNPEDIEEATISSQLYTAGLPDPDLVIRTSGEWRISNFLLWQIAYSEFWVTPVLWPDFGEEELRAALDDYGRRERRFGGRPEEVKSKK